MNDQELIEAVATEVMGWQPVMFDVLDIKNCWIGEDGKEIIFDPLANANHWMMVVKKLRSEILRFIVWVHVQGYYYVSFTCDIQEDTTSYATKHKSIGHAVCLTALKTVRGLKK